MNRALTTLLSIQELDTEIAKLERLIRGGIPELAEKRESLKLLKRRIEDLTKQLKTSQKDAGLREGELQEHEGKIEKYREQLNAIKDNVQYRALLKEIETENATKGQLETMVLEAYEIAETVKSEIDQVRDLVGKADSENEEIEELNRQVMAESRAKLDKLLAERRELTGQIDAVTLAKYEQVQRSRADVLVPVRDRTCTGCFMNVTPQIYNHLLSDREVTFCHSCGRILYLPPVHDG